MEKSITKNVFFKGMLNFFKIALPIIIMPLVARKIGPALNGYMAYSQTLQTIAFVADFIFKDTGYEMKNVILKSIFKAAGFVGLYLLILIAAKDETFVSLWEKIKGMTVRKFIKEKAA